MTKPHVCWCDEVHALVSVEDERLNMLLCGRMKILREERERYQPKPKSLFGNIIEFSKVRKW